MLYLNTENTLYHYTSLNIFMRYILPARQLKLGKIMDSRDPYEYQAFKTRLMIDDQLQNDIGFLEYINAARDLKLNSQYLCFTMPESEQKGDYYYTRWGYDKPKLWEMYGDNHQGVCISLDKAKFINVFNNTVNDIENSQIAHAKIVYKDIVCRSDELKKRTLADFYREVRCFNKTEFLEEFKEPFFFQKDHDYQDENEYRFIYITDQKQEDLRIDISNVVTALFFGDKVDVEIIEYYKKLFKKEFPGIQLEQVRWFNGTAYHIGLNS